MICLQYRNILFLLIKLFNFARLSVDAQIDNF